MGNKQAQGSSQRGNKDNERPKGGEHSAAILVQPFREGNVLSAESKLKEYLRKAGDEQNEGDEKEQRGQDLLKQFKDDQFKVENIQKEIIFLEESVFSREKLTRIREDFEAYSKENKVSRKKLLEYFGMGELENKRLGNRLFQCVKSTFSQQKTGPFLDYPKFLKAISMLSQRNEEGRLRFLYSMFDINLDGSIEKDEMYNLMMMFLEVFNTFERLQQGMMSVQYENQDLNELKQRISESHDRQIELALEELVNEIYGQYSFKQNVLTYDEWKNWLLSQEGITEILKFDPHTDFQD